MEHQQIDYLEQQQSDAIIENGGGLLIKLKMAKVEPYSEQGNRNSEKLAAQFTKICHICQKGFVSGKALGGHMRMHAQESKGLIKSSSKSPKPVLVKSRATEVSTSITDSSSGEPVCIECGKIFPSKKSLYGHMRSHPDRPYRGIEPPQSAKNSSTSTLSDFLPQSNHKAAAEDQHIDSARTGRIWFGLNPKKVRNLPIWSQTAKRGRKGTSSLSDTDSESDDDFGGDDGADVDDDDELDMSEAVHDLMMLAQANPKGAEEATNSNFMTKNPEYHDVKDRRVIDYLGVSKKRMQKLEPEEDVDLARWFGLEKPNHLELGLNLREDSEEELSDSENAESIALANMMKRKKRRKMKLKDLEGGVVAAQDYPYQGHHHKVYSCSLCNKSFQSHQALGGHMSSHSKLKNNNIQYSMEHDHHHSGSEDNNENAKFTNRATQVDHDQAESHQCRICYKTFPTGQALGGHKRSHYTSPNDQAQPSQTERKGLNIDLNEPPPMENEQGIDYSGAGYATSSYNSVT